MIRAIGRVDDAHPVGGQVPRQLGDPSGDVDLGLAGTHDRPGPGESVLEVEHVGQGVAGGRDPGAPGQRDLAEAEVLDARGALTAGVDQHVAQPACGRAVRTLGRVGRVDRRPLRQDLEVAHLGQPTLPHHATRLGQEARLVEVGEGVGHVFDCSR